MARIVTAAIIIRNGRVLCTRRAPGQSHAGAWEFPGGKLGKGETWRGCLEREIQEELGVTGHAGEKVCEVMHTYARGAIRLVAYRFECECDAFVLRVHDEMIWADDKMLSALAFTAADRAILPLVCELL